MRLGVRACACACVCVCYTICKEAKRRKLETETERGRGSGRRRAARGRMLEHRACCVDLIKFTSVLFAVGLVTQLYLCRTVCRV